MTQDPLVAQVLSGESYELQILAAQGILPLSADTLIPLQVTLTASEDEVVASHARAALEAVEPRVAAGYLAADAPPEVLAWFAEHHLEAVILEVILRRRNVPLDLLVGLARRLSADLQEVLLLRQDAIVDRPDILLALEENPQLSIYSRRRILEYREHLLPRARGTQVPAAAMAVESELTAEDWAAIQQVHATVPKEGEVDTRTGLSEGQIRALPVPVRMKLTRGASRTLRNILLKDANALVAVSTLLNSAITEDEVEMWASSRVVVEDVLAAIGRKREWASHYNVALNLVRNPRTPVAVAVRLVPRLAVRELKVLARDRNVSDAVRATADRLYKIKNK